MGRLTPLPYPCLSTCTCMFGQTPGSSTGHLISQQQQQTPLFKAGGLGLGIGGLATGGPRTGGLGTSGIGLGTHGLGAGGLQTGGVGGGMGTSGFVLSGGMCFP